MFDKYVYCCYYLSCIYRCDVCDDMLLPWSYAYISSMVNRGNKFSVTENYFIRVIKTTYFVRLLTCGHLNISVVISVNFDNHTNNFYLSHNSDSSFTIAQKIKSFILSIQTHSLSFVTITKTINYFHSSFSMMYHQSAKLHSYLM